MTRALTNFPLLLRLEGGAYLMLAVLLYSKIGGSWLLFALLLLVPDISILGYLGGPVRGAAIYNLVHLAVWPAILGAIGILTDDRTIMALALIWFSHINMDRLFGFGLKRPTEFNDTHLGSFGKRAA